MSQGRVFNAPQEQKGPVPAYVVRENTEPRTREICQFDEKSKTIKRVQVEVDGGYYVDFPRGHSNFYHSLEALESAGFGEVVELIRLGGESEVNSEHDGEKTLVQQPIQRKNGR